MNMNKLTDALDRGSAWYSKNRHHVLGSLDAKMGYGAFGITFVAGSVSENLRSTAVDLFLPVAGLGMAVLGVALTAVALLLGLLGVEYLRVLHDEQGSLHEAFQPFTVTATVGGSTALFSIASFVLWNVPSPLSAVDWAARAFALAVTAGLLTWGVVGTIQIVHDAVWHGEQRNKLLDTIQEARKLANMKKRERPGA